jgi:hypothetical protein
MQEATTSPTPLTVAQELGIFSSTTYSWDEHETSTVWNTIDLKSGKISLLTNSSGISEMVWAGSTNTSIIYINGTNDEDDGGISIYAGDTKAIDNA